MDGRMLYIYTYIYIEQYGMILYQEMDDSIYIRYYYVLITAPLAARNLPDFSHTSRAHPWGSLTNVGLLNTA